MSKGPDAFRTISEVAEELKLPQHVLRFWETRFAQIRPLKRGGGRRYYRPDDVDLLRGIRRLLYGEGYTIRGVQRILREQGLKFVQAVWQPGAAQPAPPSIEDLAPEEPQPTAAANVHALHAEPLVSRVEPELRSPAPMSNPSQVSYAVLRSEERRKLQAALEELGECRKIIDAVLRSSDADAA